MSLAVDRLTDELTKYETAREQLTVQLERLERSKAQVLAQLHACLGAIQAVTALLPSPDATADTLDSSADAVLTDEPAPESPKESYVNGRAESN